MLVQIAATLALGGYRDIRASLSFSGHVLTWLMASMLTLVVYALWPEAWRFSRAAVLSMVVGHAVIHGWVTWRALKRSGHAHHMRRLLVSDEDTERLIDLLRRNEGERTRFNVFALWPSLRGHPRCPASKGCPGLGRFGICKKRCRFTTSKRWCSAAEMFEPMSSWRPCPCWERSV